MKKIISSTTPVTRVRTLGVDDKGDKVKVAVEVNVYDRTADKYLVKSIIEQQLEDAVDVDDLEFGSGYIDEAFSRKAERFYTFGVDASTLRFEHGISRDEYHDEWAELDPEERVQKLLERYID